MKSSCNNLFVNVATGVKTSLKELAEILLKLTNSNNKITYKHQNLETIVRNRVGCPEKAKKELNFSYSIKLKYGLSNFIEWYLKKIKNLEYS